MKTLTTTYWSVIRKKTLILQQLILISLLLAHLLRKKDTGWKFHWKKRSGRNRRYLLKKMYLTEDFLPSLQKRPNRNKEYVTLYQKGGFGGGKHLSSLSHSLLYKYFLEDNYKLNPWTYDLKCALGNSRKA